MGFQQKIINILSIALFLYVLYYLYGLILPTYKHRQQYLSILTTIGGGEPL